MYGEMFESWYSHQVGALFTLIDLNIIEVIPVRLGRALPDSNLTHNLSNHCL